MVKLLGKPLEDVVANSMINTTALTKNNFHIKKCFGDRLMVPFRNEYGQINLINGRIFITLSSFISSSNPYCSWEKRLSDKSHRFYQLL